MVDIAKKGRVSESGRLSLSTAKQRILVWNWSKYSH